MWKEAEVPGKQPRARLEGRCHRWVLRIVSRWVPLLGMERARAVIPLCYMPLPTEAILSAAMRWGSFQGLSCVWPNAWRWFLAATRLRALCAREGGRGTCPAWLAEHLFSRDSGKQSWKKAVEEDTKDQLETAKEKISKCLNVDHMTVGTLPQPRTSLQGLVINPFYRAVAKQMDVTQILIIKTSPTGNLSNLL